MLDRLRGQMLEDAITETFILLSVTAVFLIIIGVMLGYLLFITEPNGMFNNKRYKTLIHRTLSIVVDTFRSIPFIILIIILIPFTLFLVNTMIGAKAAIPALIISASPFYARVVYNSFKDVPKSNIEALVSMGANRLTVFRCLLKEAMPSLISGLTITLVTLVGFIASAGVIGTGGLGKLAIERYRASDYVLMYISVALLLLIVFIIQFSGDAISRKIDKR